jgi:hypothetical protein
MTLSHPGTRIRIPDAGVKNAADPGSATLKNIKYDILL